MGSRNTRSSRKMLSTGPPPDRRGVLFREALTVDVFLEEQGEVFLDGFNSFAKVDVVVIRSSFFGFFLFCLGDFVVLFEDVQGGV